MHQNVIADGEVFTFGADVLLARTAVPLRVISRLLSALFPDTLNPLRQATTRARGKAQSFPQIPSVLFTSPVAGSNATPMFFAKRRRA